MVGWKRGRSTSTYVECAGVGDGRLAKHARGDICDVDVREAGTSTKGGGVGHASVRGGRTTTTTMSPTSSVSTMTTTTTTTTTTEPTPCGGGGGWTDDAMDVDGSTASSPARRVLAHRREFGFGFGFGFGGGVARALAFGSPSRGAFPLDPSA